MQMMVTEYFRTTAVCLTLPASWSQIARKTTSQLLNNLFVFDLIIGFVDASLHDMLTADSTISTLRQNNLFRERIHRPNYAQNEPFERICGLYTSTVTMSLGRKSFR